MSRSEKETDEILAGIIVALVVLLCLGYLAYKATVHVLRPVTAAVAEVAARK